MLGEVVQGSDPAADRNSARTAMTVSELCDQYMVDAREGRLLTRSGRSKRDATIKSDAVRVNANIKPLLGRAIVANLTRTDVEAFMHQLAEGGLPRKRGSKVEVRRIGGKGTATRCLGLMGSMFTYAIRRGLMRDNPVRGVIRFADGKRERRLTEAEYSQLGSGLEAVATELPPVRPGVRAAGPTWPPTRAVMRFLAITGWRGSEALGLRWSEIDLVIPLFRG